MWQWRGENITLRCVDVQVVHFEASAKLEEAAF